MRFSYVVSLFYLLLPAFLEIVCKMNATQQDRIVGNKDWNGLHRPQIYVAMSAILCGLFFSVMDGTVCNVALPTLAEELQVSSSDSIWLVNAFQLVIIIMLLPFAALGELYSYRKIYLWGMVMFTTGSLLCALSSTFGELIAARVVQGIGAAMVMSINVSLVRLIYPRRHLGKGIGLNSMVVALGLVIGPVFTGAVLSVTTWQWLFIVNIPFGIVTIILARRSLPENPTKIEGRHFDFKEALLNALTFGLFIGCFEALSHDADLLVVAAGAVLFVISAMAFIRNQKHKDYPMLPLDLLSLPVFSMSVLTSIISFASQMLAMIAMPFLLTHTFGYDAGQTGLLMTSYPVVILFVAPVAGLLINKVNPEIMCASGLFVLCIGSFLLAYIPEGSGFWDIAWRFAICGIGFGFFQSPNNHLIISSAPQHRAGSAGGMIASARMVGQTLGAACVAMLFHFFGSQGTVASLILGGILSLAGMLSSVARYYRMRRHAMRNS